MYDFFPRQLFHISDDPAIKKFVPRPSPSYFDTIEGDIVFAINDHRVHNYLLPRQCPRVCFCAKADSAPEDIEKLIGPAKTGNVIALESKWLPIIRETTIYCYELPVQTFMLLDECAGYYISYEPVIPLSVRPVNDLLTELLHRQVDIRILPTLWPLAEMITKSTLNYSLIRMRNAQK